MVSNEILLLFGILAAIFVVYLLVPKEGYANQVVHAGVGGIAGPMERYTTYNDGVIPERRYF